MRVTENSNYDTIRESINRGKSRMENLQRQQATLKKLNAPSDDPVGSAKLLEIRTDKVNNEQFTSNAKLAEAFLNNSDNAIGQLADIVVRAKEIALSQSSGASSNESTRTGVSQEVTQLYNQAVSTANTRVGDRFLFAGYKTNIAPVDPDGRYRGDQGEIMIEISKDVFIPMNVPGLSAFNTRPEGSNDLDTLKNKQGSEELVVDGGRAPASLASTEEGDIQGSPDNLNIFNELQNLRIGLLTGDLDGIRNTLDRFDELHGSLIATRAKIGSRIQGLQTATAALDRHGITNAQLASNIEDADMAQVVSDLAKEETVYRSALHSSQKLVQPTLMDFLK